ncbi:MAG: 30S ribosomal protein S8 [Candidatus Moraniibacteriota bacterium]|nr:MAG: 30S ribosomal protein S8 [Candidatus Moranbacteria bacterium]
MIDSISDMLTRIRNAHAARHAEVVMPMSKLKFAIAQVLEKEDFIDGVERVQDEDNEKFENIRITLKYDQISSTIKKPAIEGIRQISKQGQRRYVKKDDIHKVRNGYGISVISTSQGVMSGKEARKKGLGGELICELW